MAWFNTADIGNPLGKNSTLMSLGNTGSDPGVAQLQQILGQLEQGKQAQRIGTERAIGEQRRAIPLVSKAYGDAQANAASQATQTKRMVMANTGSRLAGSDIKTGASGFGDSNLATLAHRGIYGDQTRALNSIDQMFQQHFGQLATGEASDLAGIQGNIGRLQAQGTQGLTGLYGDTAKAIGDVTYQPKKSLLDVLGQAAPLIAMAAAFA